MKLTRLQNDKSKLPVVLARDVRYAYTFHANCTMILMGSDRSLASVFHGTSA